LTLFYNHIQASRPGTDQLLDRITITLKNRIDNSLLLVYVDIFDNSLSRKWLPALNYLISNNYHLEKNYCFVGFANSDRSPEYICNQINRSIQAINDAEVGYQIDDFFTVENTINSGPVGVGLPGLTLDRNKMNVLHRYFEDLQGQSGRMS